VTRAGAAQARNGGVRAGASYPGRRGRDVKFDYHIPVCAWFFSYRHPLSLHDLGPRTLLEHR